MTAKIKQILKNIDSTLEVIYKKSDNRMDRICVEKYYGFEPENDKDYFTLWTIKDLILLIQKEILKIKKELDNAK